MKRKMTERKCPRCLKTSFVRLDSVGKYCSSCRAKINSENKKPKDISGKFFGKLKVLEFSHIDKTAYWKCVCECENNCIISGARLRNGHTKSCGCINKTQKGMSTSASYRSWASMIQRCYDNKVYHYKRYGMKGIEVCERWKNSFENFLFDMGERPKGKTLDRINYKENYFKENCKWSTCKEQANNTSSNFTIEYLNTSQTLTQWSEQIGIGWSTLRKRIVVLKWNIEKALTQPVRKKCL